MLIFGNSDALGRNAWTYEGGSFDNCGGHPQQQGAYHYHTQPAPGCIASQTVVAGQHSPIFGLMADGVPIFGPLGDNGITASGLDACRGHVDSSFAFYHYHLPLNYAFPYTLPCLMGCVSGKGTCTPGSQQYDYTSVKDLFTAAIPTASAVAPSQKFTAYVASVFLVSSPPPPSPSPVQSTYSNTATPSTATLSTGAIIGISIGGFAALVLIAGISVVIMKSGGKASKQVVHSESA